MAAGAAAADEDTLPARSRVRGFLAARASLADPRCTDSARGVASAVCAGHVPGAVMSGPRRSPCLPSSP
jgi:hypothetical protein